MDKHYEEPKYLTLCNTDYDISNVSKGRVDRAKDYWNKAQGIGFTRQGKVKQEEKKELTAKQYENLINKIGLMLIRQDWLTLRHRMTIKQAAVEYIKRGMLTLKKLNRANREEYQIFQDWVVFVLFGRTPEDLKKKSQMELLAIQLYKTLEENNLSVDQCLESFRIFANQLVGKLNT